MNIGIGSALQGSRLYWRFMGQESQEDIQFEAGFKRMLQQYQFGATW